jgi:hypothetical protein
MVVYCPKMYCEYLLLPPVFDDPDRRSIIEKIVAPSSSSKSSSIVGIGNRSLTITMFNPYNQCKNAMTRPFI